MGIEKGMGLRKGEKVVRLGRIRILSSHEQPLMDMPEEDCALEGFPELSPREFITMFANHNKVVPEQVINRIQFEYVD